ncbi:unnamed protein product, partial [Tilletia laevis]
MSASTQDTQAAAPARKRPRLSRYSNVELDWAAAEPGLPYPPKQWQKDAVAGLARGQDGLVIAPTGSGKGYILNLLLHMLPDKTFVVMEPLQSLLEELAARMGKEAVYIHAENRTPKLFEEIKAGKFRLVFVSPEMAIGNAFKEVLLDSNFKASLGGIVFDECQVLKDWAVDSTFRKGIKDVSILRHLADIPGLAMSGTLPANYRKEVLRHFELNDPFVLDIGVDRPNIEYVVAPIRYPLASFRDILAWLPELHGTKPANDAEMRAL